MTGALLHEGLERAADRFGDRDAVRAGDDAWSFADLDGWSNAFARHLAGRGVAAGRPRGGDDDQPGRVRRRRRTAISKLGAAAVLLSPAWKATEVGHALELTGPRHAVADGRIGVAARRPAGRRCVSPTSTTRRRSPVSPPAPGTAVGVGRAGRDRRGRPRVQLRHDRAARRRCATPTARWPAPPPTGARPSASAPTTASRWPRRRRTSSACSTCSPPPRPGATVRLHPRFDLDEVLRRIESDRMTLEMAVAPDRAGPGQPPAPRGRSTSRRCATSCGARRPVTESVAEAVTERTGVRWLPAYGASELPVIAVQPGRRPDAWRLDSAGLPPAGRRAAGRRPRHRRGPRRPARSARSRPAARRSWPATSPTRRTPTPSSTAGTAPATSAGSSPRAGSTSPTAPRR